MAMKRLLWAALCYTPEGHHLQLKSKCISTPSVDEDRAVLTPRPVPEGVQGTAFLCRLLSPALDSSAPSSTLGWGGTGKEEKRCHAAHLTAQWGSAYGQLLPGALGLRGVPCGRKQGRKEHFCCLALTGPPLHIPRVWTSLLPQTPPTQSSFIR